MKINKDYEFKKAVIELMEEEKKRTKLKMYVPKCKMPLVDEIHKENLDYLEEWLVNGWEILEFYLVQEHGLDMFLALEYKKLQRILG